MLPSRGRDGNDEEKGEVESGVDATRMQRLYEWYSSYVNGEVKQETKQSFTFFRAAV